jgi:serine/threonine-protein kinase
MTSGPDLLLSALRAATADEYQIERELGRGGMAAVFLARDIALQRRVAIKVMLPDLVNVHGVQDRFVIEARTAAHLDHPGIVSVYSVKQRAGLLYIVMKYIEGHTLEAVLRSQGQIDPIATALIGSRVAEALHFAHGEGVIHRDVKPSNIMIDTRGRPVVTDFGIARVMTAQSITVAGSMLGTPTHMSPEQCRGQPATAASDQYALGVTMYEMITGRVPFTGSLFELITAHREQTPPPLSEFAAGVEPALEQTVMRMLAKDPAERWGSMGDVVQRLAGHTTMHRGDENLRATLVMSGSGTATPERGVASADVLTPPENVSTPVTPVSVSGAPSPVPASSGPSPAAAQLPFPAPLDAAPARVRDAKGGRVFLWSAAGLLAAVMVAALVWSGQSSSRTASLTKNDSAAKVTQTGADSVRLSATRDSAVRDSLVRDSSAKALAAIRDSIARDSIAKESATRAIATRDSLAKDSATRADLAKATARSNAAAAARARRDSARARVRPESVPVQCARLLERQSLGEKLTDAERAILQQRCPK